jgi:hypothetical protein
MLFMAIKVRLAFDFAGKLSNLKEVVRKARRD